MRTFTVGSLFAGIGGFDLGFERAGFKTDWQVEIDEYCRKVLAKNFPHAERYGDIRECGAHNLNPVDVICGGFPCQDISVAGKGAGIEGARSGLWREMHRVIRELRPRFVVVENVAALLGRGMGRVLGDLSEIGYDAEWQVISAADVGAPHLRKRIWIVAYPICESAQHQRTAGYVDRSTRTGESTEDQRERVRHASGCGSEDVAHAGGQGLSQRVLHAGGQGLSQRVLHAGVPGEADFREEGQAAVMGGSVGHTSRELQYGSGVWTEQAGRREFANTGRWAVEPNVGRVAHGIPARVDRLRALGNAVVPEIPELIAKCLLHQLKSESTDAHAND